MFSPAVLLRIVLSLALILNGIGSAIAATRMLEHMTPQPSSNPVASVHDHHAMAVAADASAPCHDPGGKTDAPGKSPATSPADESGVPPHEMGCCSSGMCSCECLQQGQVAFAVAVFSQAAVQLSVAVRTMTSAHASPTLPHLIRPPIA